VSRIFTVTEAAQRVHRSVKTLQRWDREGVWTAQRTPTGRRFYTEEQIQHFLGQVPPVHERAVVAYCRVSSQAQRSDLKNQRQVLETFCVARGLAPVEFIEEIGGGLDFKRPQFLALIDRILRHEVRTLIVAHKDRLARFGFDLLTHLCRQYQCTLLILNNETLSPDHELVQDLLSVVQTFSSRLYGLRTYRRALKKALTT